MTELEQRVSKIVSNIMSVPLESVGPESSPDNLDAWTSVQHMNLILALEQEFDVQLSDDQIVEMLSVKRIAAELAGAV